MWRRGGSDLGRQIRRNRPRPEDELVGRLLDSIDAETRQARRPLARRALAVAALPLGMVVLLASSGGLGYAAGGAATAFDSVKKAVVAPARAEKPAVVEQSAGQDQYKPTRVTICHKGHTIVVSSASLDAHLAHGDRQGPC